MRLSSVIALTAFALLASASPIIDRSTQASNTVQKRGPTQGDSVGSKDESKNQNQYDYSVLDPDHASHLFGLISPIRPNNRDDNKETGKKADAAISEPAKGEPAKGKPAKKEKNRRRRR